ncbi:uncharacterized protein LOC134763689 [Penaeus indicus]|uniref:uncharacterized protein LOC134763689 n=1 Tax=Penaeus indicus TaxID=29960 RepID=UPI00300D7031
MTVKFTLISTYSSAQPDSQCRRYDKKQKTESMIPSIDYSWFMVSVDLMDVLLSLYKIHVRSKNYKVSYHFLDVTVLNSWTFYRRDYREHSIPSSNMLILQEFKLLLDETLLEGKSTVSEKSGRLSLEIIVSQFTERKTHAAKQIPRENIRDGQYHYLVVVKRGRGEKKHNKTGCGVCPVTFCCTCNVHLCLNNKNCFLGFHMA